MCVCGRCGVREEEMVSRDSKLPFRWRMIYGHRISTIRPVLEGRRLAELSERYLSTVCVCVSECNLQRLWFA